MAVEWTHCDNVQRWPNQMWTLDCHYRAAPVLDLVCVHRCSTCKSEIFRTFIRLVCDTKDECLPLTLRLAKAWMISIQIGFHCKQRFWVIIVITDMVHFQFSIYRSRRNWARCRNSSKTNYEKPPWNWVYVFVFDSSFRLRPAMTLVVDDKNNNRVNIDCHLKMR